MGKDGREFETRRNREATWLTSREDKEKGEDPGTGGSGGEGGEINDPLTRRDVEAPRAPFEAAPRSDD